MATQRTIEVFSAGCLVCEDTVQLVNQITCPSCDVSVLDMGDPPVAQRAKSLGVRSVPAVVIDGKLANCCGEPWPGDCASRRGPGTAAGVGAAAGLTASPRGR